METYENISLYQKVNFFEKLKALPLERNIEDSIADTIKIFRILRKEDSIENFSFEDLLSTTFNTIDKNTFDPKQPSDIDVFVVTMRVNNTYKVYKIDETNYDFYKKLTEDYKVKV